MCKGVSVNALIQNDPFILHKISLTPFSETPLHISALLGHVEFTKAIVRQMPWLVTELDSSKRSPLHLAAAEGHSQIVKELLIANKDVSMVADQEGRIPLHLAAMRGRVETATYLLSVPKIRVDLNSLTKNGFPAFDGISRNGTIQRNLRKNPIKETNTKVKTIQAPRKLQFN
ncbi:ankyrin repeat-containing protein BDA1-like [Mangifera indica]|uniref:ankyrin repeat-containing protein BDA1-like n=1 Tax=Mangifera indica TaxID=29780 RepID=UPI001CFBEB3E|nr:ankyrin repeat-containing protein BDA1-like [Mangifera indica]